jgi:phage repressor protein C with HTH and peptisase S24 domain
MHPGPMIRRLRQDRDWKLERLADEVERHLGKPVNTGNLSRLEREGQGYSNEFLQAVAKALEVPVATLFEAPAVREPRAVFTRTAPQSPEEQDEAIEIRRFENPASLGGGLPRQEADVLVGRMQVSMTWVQQKLPNITSPKNLEIIVGFGNSMEPTFCDGDLMLVDRGVREVKIDCVYVFAIGDELFIKTLQRLPGNVLRVISDNKKYDPYIIGPESRAEVEILGRVVWAWNGRKL